MSTHRIQMLLDRSGSMASYRAQTIDAVNGYLASLRADPLAAETTFSLTTFDSESIDAVRRNEPGLRVRELDAREFDPRSATPLYDAIGHVIDQEAEIRVSGRRAIVLVTDGSENGSRRVSAEAVKQLVTRYERDGWTFIFLGANQDARVEAAKVGVPERRAIAYRAGSGTSAAATFAAAAAVSFAYFTLNPGDAGAAQPGFTESDRRAAFDGAADWKSEMLRDMGAAPSEPAPPDGGNGPAISDPSSSAARAYDDRAPDTSEAATDVPDGEGSVLDAITGTVSDAIGSVLSIFGGDD